MGQFFAIAAALVPSLGAMWAGSRALLRDDAARRERRVRKEVTRASHEWYDEARERARVAAENDPTNPRAFAEHWEKGKKAVEERVDQRLAHYGMTPTKTLGEFNVDVSMSKRAFSRPERFDQWLLIWSAAMGVIMLAVSLLLD